MIYAEDDMLMLSGIQHFMFCPRQWALIHIEQLWEENKLTVEGQLLHTNVDNPSYRQKNGDTITLRSVAIASKKLGLYGFTDAVELIPTSDKDKGIKHNKYPGLWKPFPIEYKRGKPKTSMADEVQLAAQVMCLEEMYEITIDYGAIFYGEIKHRSVIHVSEDLRLLTMRLAKEMHKIYKEGALPKAEKSSCCGKCSLTDICMPKKKKQNNIEI
jgi:CRISPR-associated exonuclease Cas4